MTIDATGPEPTAGDAENGAHPRAILILGMHRSGTSAVAGICKQLGCETPNDLIPAADDNPKGFFESARFVAFNDRLLATLGSRYDEPASLGARQLQALRDLGVVDDLALLVRRQLGRAPLVVVKDPRICRLAPIWIDALERTGRQVSTLHPLRHPLEVAGSLAKRNGFSQTQGLLLWLDHALAAERASRGRPRSFILYDDVLADWRSSVSKISGDLSLLWPRSVARMEAEIDAFITDDLRHHKAREHSFTEGDVLHSLVLRSWTGLQRLTQGPSDPQASDELDGVRTELDASEALYGGYISASQNLLYERFDRIEALERHAAHMDRALTRAGADRQAFAEAAEAAKVHADDLEADAARYRSEAEQASREAAGLAAALDTARNETKDAVSALDDLRQAHSATEAHYSRVEADFRRLEGDLRHVADALRGTEDHLATLRNSVSWRLGMPIRLVGRLLPAGVRNRAGRALRASHERLRALVLRAPAATPAAEDVVDVRPAAIPADERDGPAVGDVEARPSSGGDPVADNKPERPGSPADLADSPVEVDHVSAERDASEPEDAASRYMSPTPEQLHLARMIGDSDLFDEAYYAAHDTSADRLDRVLHYVVEGERSGFRPSPQFDPQFYRTRYPDVAEGLPSLLFHFIAHGRSEGRAGTSAAGRMPFPQVDLDPSRRTVLIIAHEASRTGAPILAWNIAKGLRSSHNVIVLLMRGGEFEPAFEREADVLLGPVGAPDCFDKVEVRFVVQRILQDYRIDFCIANSLETRDFAVELSRSLVPVIALVHEFSTYYRPPGTLHDIYETASQVVFPANIVRDVSIEDYMALRRRRSEVLPQGPSIVPDLEIPADNSDAPPATLFEREKILSRLRPKGAEDAFLVLGMGTVQHRKGVDLFIAAASAAVRAAPERSFRFVWIGHGYRPQDDLQYSVYLQAQIRFSGLDGVLEIIDNVADLETVYGEMDALVLSSRADPLPNVSIDAAMHGIPVICFAGASGMAELLSSDPVLAGLVVPHLDSTAAGQALAELASNRDHLDELRREIFRFASNTFDMDEYVKAIIELGHAAIDSLKDVDSYLYFVRDNENAFELDFYRGNLLTDLDSQQAVKHYLIQNAHRDFSDPRSYAYSRRPLPGFSPLRYAEEHHFEARQDRPDPLVDYLSAGRPKGPWTHHVIRPGDPSVGRASSNRVVLHGHFYYPDLFEDFMRRVNANDCPLDLLLTTDQPEKAEILRASSAGFRLGEVRVTVVPNAGRDIGPFLTGLGSIALDRYDVVGHLHGKQSAHTREVDRTYGDRWRDFLWEHLIGGRHPMADIILSRFAENERLGLVFPEDPNIVGWDGSEATAVELAERLRIETPLPKAFDFPNGTMFWARTAALKPLFDLDLDWKDYPAEPLPKDGTLLHALERLLPFVVEASGFEFETTQVPEVFR